MATFFEDLWNSIFTPGPTPTLLLATNAAFGALSVVLIALLLSTYSIHFVVLLAITGGLWWGINWFASEVAAFKAEQEAKQGAVNSSQQGSEEASTNDQIGTESSGDQGKATSEKEALSSSLEATESTQARPRIVSSDSTGDASTDSDWERVEKTDR
ncbi:SMK killer toxin resistance protein [Ascosphaera atra]|nr:SMK killer toxin resistance protein [Ascosphaera atra]